MAKPPVQDEMLYCARCGISFLWTSEEQRQLGVVEPLHCPGCRQLMSAPGRERGQVKWFDRRKRYGFIVRTGQPEIYIHRSAVQSDRLPRPGDLVEFAVEESDRGLQAIAMTLVEAAAPSAQTE
ncbi:cold shock domain-containing protein [Caldilinea sp.]|uniref:cold shock domain-containing protein n=1 Tax=Caldilinea sp. TaxID=2293560 RepID=UPI002BE5E5D4|nr:cold shock domain-containing protein [Caldilinea sp.]HRA65695.1 cold shock domain-containing protein [Caldilinea sp.]